MEIKQENQKTVSPIKILCKGHFCDNYTLISLVNESEPVMFIRFDLYNNVVNKLQEENEKLKSAKTPNLTDALKNNARSIKEKTKS